MDAKNIAACWGIARRVMYHFVVVFGPEAKKRVSQSPEPFVSLCPFYYLINRGHLLSSRKSAIWAKDTHCWR